MTTISFDAVLDDRIAFVKGNRVLLFIKGGSGSTFFGYNNKYLKIAKTVNERFGISVVVSQNPLYSEIRLKHEIDLVYRAVGPFSQLLFAGVSTGGRIAVEQSYLIKDLNTLLLINPPVTMTWPKVKASMERKMNASFNFVFGSKDPIIKFVPLLNKVETTSSVTIKIIEGASHNFEGMEGIFESLFIDFVQNNLQKK